MKRYRMGDFSGRVISYRRVLRVHLHEAYAAKPSLQKRSNALNIKALTDYGLALAGHHLPPLIVLKLLI